MIYALLVVCLMMQARAGYFSAREPVLIADVRFFSPFLHFAILFVLFALYRQ
jgi:hypothetical protein